MRNTTRRSAHPEHFIEELAPDVRSQDSDDNGEPDHEGSYREQNFETSARAGDWRDEPL